MDGSLCEAVLPIHGGKVEAIPGIWDTGATDGLVLVLVASASGQDETLEKGDVVAEVRQGLVESAVCSSCGLMDTRFMTGNGSCQSCGIAQPASFDVCEGCGDKIVQEDGFKYEADDFEVWFWSSLHVCCGFFVQLWERPEDSRS